MLYTWLSSNIFINIHSPLELPKLERQLIDSIKIIVSQYFEHFIKFITIMGLIHNQERAISRTIGGLKRKPNRRAAVTDVYVRSSITLESIPCLFEWQRMLYCSRLWETREWDGVNAHTNHKNVAEPFFLFYSDTNRFGNCSHWT